MNFMAVGLAQSSFSLGGAGVRQTCALILLFFGVTAIGMAVRCVLRSCDE